MGESPSVRIDGNETKIEVRVYPLARIWEERPGSLKLPMDISVVLRSNVSLQ